MTDAAEAQASLEETLKGEILRMYQEVAANPDAEFHFFHGRTAAELFGYAPEELDEAPDSAVASFAASETPTSAPGSSPERRSSIWGAAPVWMPSWPRDGSARRAG